VPGPQGYRSDGDQVRFDIGQEDWQQEGIGTDAWQSAMSEFQEAVGVTPRSESIARILGGMSWLAVWADGRPEEEEKVGKIAESLAGQREWMEEILATDDAGAFVDRSGKGKDVFAAIDRLAIAASNSFTPDDKALARVSDALNALSTAPFASQ
jgi:hypothetical protein